MFDKKLLLTIVVSIMLGAISMLLLQIVTDDKVQIVKLVLKHPKIFPLAAEKRAALLNKVKECKSLTENNFKKLDIGDTLETAEENCKDNILKLITKSIDKGEKYESLKGYTPLVIGNISNSFLANAVNTDDMTEIAASIYLENIRQILEAIPKNVPDKNVLSKFTIAEVRFYDKYAKITFKEDRLAEQLKKENQAYKGQF